MSNEIKHFSGYSEYKRRGSAVNKNSYKRQNIEEILKEFGPLPYEALFLGVATDGLPVLLNMHDDVPGPILVVGDKGSGKTDLLKTMAKGIPLMHDSRLTQYAVITFDVDEWDSIEDADHMAAMFDLRDMAANQLIDSLAKWAKINRGSRQSTVFMLDGLENIRFMEEQTKENFNWLLKNGAKNKVWVIATCNTEKVISMPSILDTFKTRVYGNVLGSHKENRIDASGANLADLKANEFKIREHNKWLKFWLPK